LRNAGIPVNQLFEDITGLLEPILFGVVISGSRGRGREERDKDGDGHHPRCVDRSEVLGSLIHL
jgi:hypothetical protein